MRQNAAEALEASLGKVTMQPRAEPDRCSSARRVSNTVLDLLSHTTRSTAGFRFVRQHEIGEAYSVRQMFAMDRRRERGHRRAEER